MSVLLHIGAGIQFSTLWLNTVHDKEISTYILVDSSPKWMVCDPVTENNEICTTESNQFIYDITTIPSTFYGYELINAGEEDVYVFKNHKLNKTLKYYINVYFPRDFPEALAEDIKLVDTLLVCGFFPDPVLYTYLDVKKLTILTSNLSVWTGEKLMELPTERKALMSIVFETSDPCYPEPINESYLESFTDDFIGLLRYQRFIEENNVNISSMSPM